MTARAKHYHATMAPVWIPRPLEADWRATLEGVLRVRRLPAGNAAAVRALSAAYNEVDVKYTHRPPRDAAALGARLSFFFPRDVAKASGAARELAQARALGPTDRPLRVLDLGAGPGASTWGLARAFGAFGGGAVEALLVDDDAPALAAGAEIARDRGGPVVATCVAKDVRRFTTEERFDVVVLGQVLAELGASVEDDAARLGALLARNVADHGSVVVIEPALRERARHLHRVRDRLAARGTTVFAPCPHLCPCPMLARERDWCHEALDVDLPEWLAPLAKGAGLRWQGLTFSYLVLRRDALSLGARFQGAQRVVSRPLVTKGKRELDLCGGAGLVRLVRLDRHATKANDAYGSAGRGALLAIEPAPVAPGPCRVGEDTRVAPVEVDALAPLR